jgi:hypothetical protein
MTNAGELNAEIAQAVKARKFHQDVVSGLQYSNQAADIERREISKLEIVRLTALRAELIRERDEVLKNDQ